MKLSPASYKRGDSLEKFQGNVVGALGAFSQACVNGVSLLEPLEVLLVQGNRRDGFFARLGDAHHRLYEGRLSSAVVSFTIESFQIDCAGDPLARLLKDSACLRFDAAKNLREFILNAAAKHGVQGALLHVKGIAEEIHTYGHKDAFKLNDQTKTFDHPQGEQAVEGWGNLSFVDGKTPMVHVHGVYESGGARRGGHFIMDDKTHLRLAKAELMIYPTAPIIRSVQSEDFPTWK